MGSLDVLLSTNHPHTLELIPGLRVLYLLYVLFIAYF